MIEVVQRSSADEHLTGLLFKKKKKNKPNSILGESSQNGKTDKGTPVSVS